MRRAEDYHGIPVTDSSLSVNSYHGHFVHTCVCECANGSYTMSVSIALAILCASVPDTCGFLCTSVPEQTGLLPGTPHFHFNSVNCLCVSDKTSDSFMTASAAGNSSLPHIGRLCIFLSKATCSHSVCFHLFPTLSHLLPGFISKHGEDMPGRAKDVE